ncbi:MAG: ABC transporter ATP-binding protein [Parasporobacterium sp.]|nr:ABC transporter ATP-binding protein [Parasporobacterium sp.]
MDSGKITTMIIPALKKTYRDKTVLDIPETAIRDGSITAVCGRNGSGKSTLARILAGVIKDDSGTSLALSGHTGYMCQASLPFRLSVRKNLLLNADKNCSKEENQQRANRLLEEIGLQEYAKKNAARLSGGQTQRMALARVLMKSYDLLILDEPTASMDQAAIPAAEKLILDYQKRTGCTILLITHSPEQAERLADQVLLLDEGKIVSLSASVDEVLAR